MHRFAKVFRLILALGLAIPLVANALPAMALPRHAPRAQGTGPVIMPSTINLDLFPGEARSITVTVQTASTPIPQVDVLFLFDVTSSMSGVLGQAKTRGMQIMSDLRSKVPDSNFGVASVADFPAHFDFAGYEGDYGTASDYPWRLDQDLTVDVNLAQEAINRLRLLDGGDGPEAYATALFQAVSITWRPDAKHIILLFGDAPAHDVSFYVSRGGKNYGVDPGPDAQVGTSDDLTLEGVVAEVKARGIEIIPVNSDTHKIAFVQAGFQYMADETGGQVYALTNVADLPSVVAGGLFAATAVISTLTLSPDDPYRDWVTVSPVSYSKVGGGETRSFQATFNIPSGAAGQPVIFNLAIRGDSSLLGTLPVTINVGGQPPWKQITPEGDMLAEFSGTVSQGETASAGNFEVQSGHGELLIDLLWPGSSLDALVTDPTGKTVDASYPGAHLTTYTNRVHASIQHPAAGQWQLGIYGRDVPEGTTDFGVIISTRPASSSPGSFPIVILLLILGSSGVGIYVLAHAVSRTPLHVFPRLGGAAKLIGLSGECLGQALVLMPMFSIGRGGSNALCLTEGAVSYRHAVIRFADGRWFLQDQNTPLGTYVNGRRVSATALNPGDRIRIGATEFEFRMR